MNFAESAWRLTRSRRAYFDEKLFFLQKRRAKRRVELAVVIGDLRALGDVAAGDAVAVPPKRVGVVRMVDVAIVVDGQKYFAIDPIAVELDKIFRRFGQLGKFPG